mmetsp:Transcript_36281/g.116517  ORF Transcript_36281/g.116517 Transcript_36281/m.116517 type:complete len:247 (-) Transcript_36281:194-934(-)
MSSPPHPAESAKSARVPRVPTPRSEPSGTAALAACMMKVPMAFHSSTASTKSAAPGRMWTPMLAQPSAGSATKSARYVVARRDTASHSPPRTKCAKRSSSREEAMMVRTKTSGIDQECSTSAAKSSLCCAAAESGSAHSNVRARRKMRGKPTMKRMKSNWMSRIGPGPAIGEAVGSSLAMDTTDQRCRASSGPMSCPARPTTSRVNVSTVHAKVRRAPHISGASRISRRSHRGSDTSCRPRSRAKR